MTHLKYAARTLVGPWGVFVAAGLDIANLIQLGRPWRGEFLWTTEWLAIALFITGPLVSGLVAVDASRIAREDALPAASVLRRPRGPFFFAIAATALPVTAVHVLAFFTALIAGRAVVPDPGVVAVSVMALLIQIMAIWWYASLGSVVGRHLSPVAAGVAGALVALGAFYTLSWGNGFLLLNFGGATVSRLGITLSWTYLLLQALTLTVTAALLLAIPTRSSQRRWEVNARVLVILGLFVLVLVGARYLGPMERTLLASAEPPEDCWWTESVVCFYREHQRVADSTVQAIAILNHSARVAGYESLISPVIHEMSGSYRPRDPSVQGFDISSAVLEGDEWDHLFLAQMLVAPTHCPQIWDDLGPSQRYFENLEALTLTWIQLVENPNSRELEEDAFPFLEDNMLTPQEAEEASSLLASCDF